MFFLMTSTLGLFWSISRETLSGRSDESTTPFTNLRYGGTRSSQFCIICTRRTYSMGPGLKSLYRMFTGARSGMKTSAVNSEVPSALKCMVSAGGMKSWETWL